MRRIIYLIWAVLMGTWFCVAWAAAESKTEGEIWKQQADARIETIRKGDIIIEVEDAEGKTAAGALVSVEQQSHDFWFGTAISASMFSRRAADKERQKYLEILKTYYNAAVHENALKWHRTERQRDKVDFEDADRMLRWCEANGLRMRGHCIFWAREKYVPVWMRELDKDELRRRIRQRIREVLGRYKGRITEYDVNNEMLDYRFFRDRLGEDIVAEMFRWAQEVDGEAVLYLNEFDILNGKKLAAYEKLIGDLLGQGVPVGGIGCQSHYWDDSPSPEKVKEALDRLAVFELPIKITEFDKITGDEAQKADYLEDFYRVCFSHPAVEGILMWGFWQGRHWQPAGAIFDKEFRPKPAATAYRKLVYEQWWTTNQGETDSRGQYRTRGFYGRYKVRVTIGQNKTTEQSFSFRRDVGKSIRVKVNLP